MSNSALMYSRKEEHERRRTIKKLIWRLFQLLPPCLYDTIYLFMSDLVFNELSDLFLDYHKQEQLLIKTPRLLETTVLTIPLELDDSEPFVRIPDILLILVVRRCLQG